MDVFRCWIVLDKICEIEEIPIFQNGKIPRVPQRKFRQIAAVVVKRTFVHGNTLKSMCAIIGMNRSLIRIEPIHAFALID